MKKCNKCFVDKSFDCFTKDLSMRGGVAGTCRECRKTISKNYYLQNKKRTKENNKRWHKKIREKDPLYDRKRGLKTRFGITIDYYNALYVKQEGKCFICDEHFDILVVDHSHVTGKIRGLLCRQCNVGIGNLKDNAVLLERAASYIRAKS